MSHLQDPSTRLEVDIDINKFAVLVSLIHSQFQLANKYNPSQTKEPRAYTAGTVAKLHKKVLCLSN